MPSESGRPPGETQVSANRATDAADSDAADSDAAASATANSDAAASATADSDAAAPERTPIEWGPVRFERLWSLALGASVTVGGLVLAALLFVAAGVAASVLGGGASLFGGGGPPAATWALALLLFVGGPMSLLYLLVGYDQTSPARRAELRAQFGDYSFNPSRFRIGWTLAGAGAVLAVVTAAVGPGSVSPVPFLGPALAPLLFSILMFLPLIAGSRGTQLRLDPAAETVERTSRSHDRTRADDLGSVVRTRRIDLPWTTVFLLAYRGNAWYRSTPWLFAPTDRAEAVGRRLDWVLARSDGPDRASVPERLTLAVLGSFSLVVGLLLVVAAGEGAAGAALALLTAPFSLLFLALAARL